MREKLIALSMIKKGNWSEIHRFLRQDSDLNSIDDLIACQLVDQLNCEVVTIIDAHYPDVWREMSKPPFVVYLKGNCELLTSCIVAVVGGKMVSEYAKKAIRVLIKQLPVDVSVATGLERGIEVYSNKFAKSRIVCLATGFLTDDLYRKHEIYDQLTKEDLIISELPPNTKFDLQAYYRSYHLITELSQIVCVFELPSFDLRVKYLKYLTEVGKLVVVLPDKKNKNTAGGLGLINFGAKCLLKPSDVLNLL